MTVFPPGSTLSDLAKALSRHKVFIAYYEDDRVEVDAFVDRWAVREEVFIPKVLGISSSDDFINSDDTNYVMDRIRSKYLGDSTVTIVLIGICTHSRRYVDWEIKSSLRHGDVYTPNGLLGILLPSAGQGAYLPERFAANWNTAEVECYARYRYAPTSAMELRSWIEDAHAARTSRAHLITNSADMMRYNARCKVHGVTH